MTLLQLCFPSFRQHPHTPAKFWYQPLMIENNSVVEYLNIDSGAKYFSELNPNYSSFDLLSNGSVSRIVNYDLFNSRVKFYNHQDLVSKVKANESKSHVPDFGLHRDVPYPDPPLHT